MAWESGGFFGRHISELIVEGGCGWLLWMDKMSNLNSSVGANYMKKKLNVLKHNCPSSFFNRPWHSDILCST